LRDENQGIQIDLIPSIYNNIQVTVQLLLFVPQLISFILLVSWNSNLNINIGNFKYM